MATAGDELTTYQSGGDGGKLRKRPIRRSSQTTPYDRPPIAIRNNNNNPSFFAKLVDPASRLIYAGADRLFGVFRKRIPTVPAQRQLGFMWTVEEPRNVSQEAVPNLNRTPMKVGMISDLENMLKQKTFTRSEIERLIALLHSRTTESNVVEGDKAKLPSTSYQVVKPDAFASGTLNKHVEEREIRNLDAAILTPVVNSRLAKAYMGSRPTKLSLLPLRPLTQTPRQDLALLNNTATFPKTPATSHTLKTTAAIKTCENGSTTFRSRGRSALYDIPRTPYYRGPSTLSQKGVASPSVWEHEGSVGSSALDDTGSGGPMHRIRQKANLQSQQSSLSRDKSQLGSTQKLLLRNEPEPNAFKAVEETGEISKRNQSYGSVPTESSKMALKIFEQLKRMSPKEQPSGSKLAGTGTTENVDSLIGLSSSQDKQKSEGKGKHHVLFSDAREPTFQSKDTVEENGSKNIVSVDGNVKVPVETKAGSATKRAFSMSAHEDTLDLDDDNHSNGHANISVGVNKKLGASVLANNGVSTKFALPESKKGAISPGSSVVNNQKLGFYVPALTSSSSTQSTVLSQPTSVVDTVETTWRNQVNNFINSTMNNDNGNSQKPENLFGSSGSSSSAIPTTASANGVFSFGVSTNNSAIIINGTSSSPSIFASSFSFQSFGTNTNNVSSSSSSTVLSSTTTTTAVSSTFATSVSASAFSFGSATASSTTLSNGGSIFGFSYINRQRISGRLHLLPLHRRSHSSLAQGLARHHHPLQRGLFLVLQLLVLVLLLSPPHLAARPVVPPPPCSVLAPVQHQVLDLALLSPHRRPNLVALVSTKSGSSNAGASTGSSLFSFSSKLSSPAPVGNSTPVFGTSPPSNTDQMSMEDSMADDSNQTPSPAPAFGQASSGTPPGFMFGSVTPTTVQPPGFLFGAQMQPQAQAPSQSPFPATQFSAGGRFSLGSGGGDKSNRRVVRVKRQTRRK
ncbi:hypothetical protein HanXRQr2_Chr07g0302441 [Helianthus annuus]|uniref:Uncharacterized protein n=1 Tax=Helianthus annuus TaxID=4232 RepID=A0A9K3NH28_HELAN|nr:hypothetical protein HanXRQr2_Chr07g0302441 [Helianthus annuus]KAJ0550715.1 hypothetical protein HanHA300_Chr07g0249061 [Helianthus annuus]KAJ0563680.1 hypothetical protein HanHA89_Chr07g0265861 [Helianthus annuus]KAJ0729012.1 hypothetical protein HanLR1_Chr07g0248161 [Helianthus annuus]KAJ0731766.1 hypothetical protein HanOQP8_Chr07g0255701 [Helianthus annuus]